MSRNSKDLFDESTMSFGEHLEVLRVHLWKAIIGLVIGVLITLLFGDRLVDVIRSPVDKALRAQGIQSQDDISGFDLWDYLVSTFTGEKIYDGQSQITDKGVKALHSLESLGQVNLSGTNVTVEGLQSLKRRHPQLEIESDEIKAVGLADLSDLGARCRFNENFEPIQLAMSGPEIDDGHVEKIGQLLTLKLLDLRGTSISDDGLKSIAPLVQLEQLNLVGTQVSDDGLRALGGLVRLKTLLLSSPLITDKCLDIIAGFTELNYLSLSGTGITDAGLEKLGQLKQLRRLAISGRNITNTGLKTLIRLRPELRRLDLAGTRITDDGFKELVKLEQLEVLNLTHDGTSMPGEGEDAFAEISEQASVVVHLRASQLADVLHRTFPDQYEAPGAITNERRVPLQLSASEFAVFRETAERINKPITLNVQEAFMTYVKVAVVGGIVLTSPYIFWQVWLFVAAGLYPHEQRYVYVYLPFSLFLFIGGASFCFFLVFPFVLSFLLSFNEWLEVTPQIRLSEWISFAVMLPLLFGVAFQLPLVMLFLERLSIFNADTYSAKRRMAILVISIISMLLTPADPASMLLMMAPLVALYELGILMCRYMPGRNQFQAEAI